MFTLKNVINSAIEMGMETFDVHNINYTRRTFEQTKETIFDFIKGYEDDIVVYCQFGMGYHNDKIGKYVYTRPTHCAICFEIKN